MLPSIIPLITLSLAMAITFEFIYSFVCNKSQSSKTFHDVILFPDTTLISPTDNVKKNKSSFNRLIGYISKATRRLDICVFLFSCPELKRVVCDCRNRGVIVRIITDNDHVNDQASQIGALRAAGIPVRSPTSPYHMHHKFLLVDQSTVISGSLNWSQQGILGNWENVIVTNNVDIVAPFVAEFNRLWRES